MTPPTTLINQCPACGCVNIARHCKGKHCNWWRCGRATCESYGVDANKFVDMREINKGRQR